MTTETEPKLKRPQHIEGRLPLPPVLTTERLTLRPQRLSDAPSIQRLFNDWEVVKHLNNHIPWPYPDNGAETHIRDSLEKRERYYWVITLTGEDEAIGLISIHPDRGDEGEQRGFWLGRPYWGRGLMTEAAERVTEHAFLDLGWPHLWLGNAEVNAASHRVKEKQGAIIIGRKPIKVVEGDAIKVVWLLPRERWLERRGIDPDTVPLAEWPGDAPFPERLRMPTTTPVLETERLILRPMRESDTDAVQRQFDDWEVVRHLTDQVPWPYPADGAARNMVSTLREDAEREQHLWAITRRGSDELIGRIDLHADDGISRDGRGFWLGREHWGQGLMTEAANRVTQHAFETLGWPHLWLRNSELNAGSHRIKEKQGAREIARVPANYVSGPTRAVVWLLTREAWLARRGG